jgi:acetaldehyde dehydrogenase/alcohol dehydrogenase
MAGGAALTLSHDSLTPDSAFVEPRLMRSLAPHLTADGGIDALTHALESYVSVFASPRSDELCVEAVRLILRALPRAFADGRDLTARTDMARAATMAGLASGLAVGGAGRGLAHAFGARFFVPRGRAAGLFLPRVLRYNAEIPAKFTLAPGHAPYAAPEKYAQLAGTLGLAGISADDARERLFAAVDRLLMAVGMPRTIADVGLHQARYAQARDDLAMNAFRDPSLRGNPRMPLVSELRDLLHAVT